MRIQNGALGHIVLNVADLKKSEQFYRSVLGLKVSARNSTHEDDVHELRPRASRHRAAGAAQGRQAVRGKGVAKLHHFCIYVDKNEIIDQLYPILKRRKIPMVSGPETLVVAGNRSMSFLDPDGNRVEIACNANKFKFDQPKTTQAREDLD